LASRPEAVILGGGCFGKFEFELFDQELKIGPG
jgi:hypothetical protein